MFELRWHHPKVAANRYGAPSPILNARLKAYSGNKAWAIQRGKTIFDTAFGMVDKRENE
jgi:hypothetical protein